MYATSLLDHTRPAEPEKKGRVTTIRWGVPNSIVRNALYKWRTSIHARDFPDSLFGPSAILKDDMLDLLSSVGPIASVAVLERVLGGNWSWMSTYGSELWTELQKLNIPPMQPKPRQTKVAKRAQEMDDGAGDNSQARKHTRKEMTLTSSHTQSLAQTPNGLSSAALSVPPNSNPATPLRSQSIPIASSSRLPAPPSNRLVSNLQQLPPGVSQSTPFSHAHSYYQQRTPPVHNPYAHLLYYSPPPLHQGYAPLPPQYTPTRPQSAFVGGPSSLEFRNYIPANPPPHRYLVAPYQCLFPIPRTPVLKSH